jgi:hypothetical protein
MTKYHAVRTTVDGITFASKREAARYSELVLLLRAGVISNLKLQTRLIVDVNLVHICDYIADFDYIENGERIYEDCKGFKTPVYRLKKKLIEASHGITIRET